MIQIKLNYKYWEYKRYYEIWQKLAITFLLNFLVWDTVSGAIRKDLKLCRLLSLQSLPPNFEVFYVVPYYRCFEVNNNCGIKPSKIIGLVSLLDNVSLKYLNSRASMLLQIRKFEFYNKIQSICVWNHQF